MVKRLFLFLSLIAVIGHSAPTSIRELKLTGTADAGGHAITNLAPGTQSDAAATVGQLDAKGTAVLGEAKGYTDQKIGQIPPPPVETDAIALEALETHKNDKNNPHEVTAEQIGALKVESDLVALGQLNIHKMDIDIHLTERDRDILDKAITNIPPVVESDPVALQLLAAHTNDATIHMTQAGAMALITSFADTGTVARARCAEKLDDGTGGQYWLTVDGGDVVMHEIVPDTTRLYIASWSEDYNGPRDKTPKHFDGNISEVYLQWPDGFVLTTMEHGDWLYVEFSDLLINPDNAKIFGRRFLVRHPPFLLPFSGDSLSTGTCTIDYVPITNSYPLPLWPQVRAEVAAATNQVWQAMMGNTNTTIEIIGDDLTIYAESNAVKVAIWQSKASMGGGGVDQSVIDDLYSQIGVLQAAINQLAPKAWGNYAPDGSVNPEPSYMVLHNRPVTMHASGFQWATYGEISVLATYGETAFETGGDGTIRWGLDVHTNFIAMVRGGSVTIGANPDKIKLVADEMQITYPYTGGSFPQLQYTTSLFMPFEPYDGATWEDNGDGTATAYIPTVSVSGFVKATTTHQVSAYVDIGPVTRFRDGIQGDAHQTPVVYDSTITVQAGGKSYRIPAEAQ